MYLFPANIYQLMVILVSYVHTDDSSMLLCYAKVPKRSPARDTSYSSCVRPPILFTLKFIVKRVLYACEGTDYIFPWGTTEGVIPKDCAGAQSKVMRKHE